MTNREHAADSAIERFYALEEVDPRQCSHGIMLVDHLMFQVHVESISRTGKTVFYLCNAQPGQATRDLTGEWQTRTKPHWPIRFVRE